MVYHRNLSPHSLNMYDLCPRKFKNYKDHVKGIESSTIYMDAGKRVHQCIGYFYKNYRYDVESLFGEAWGVWENNPVPTQEKKAIRCFESFKRFIRFQLKKYDKIFFPNVMEVDVTSPDGKFHGIIDFYSRELRQIIDWKTNAKAVIDADMVKQGLIYKYVIEQKGLPVDKVSFYFLNGNKIKDLSNSFTYKLITDIQEQIEVDKEFKKKPSAKCRECPYSIGCFAKKKLWSDIIDRYYGS